MSHDVATSAVRLAHQGHRVFPLHGIIKGGRCTCGKGDCTSPGKHPRTVRGLHDASADPAAAAGWWRRWPTSNLGIATGALFVVDLDGHEGIATWRTIEQAHGLIPPTRMVATGGGGQHIYLRAPAEPLGNSCHRLGPGIDTRGVGGYVVAPPSLHVSGRRYEWANAERAAPCPEWLLELLRPPVRSPLRTSRPARGHNLGCDRRLAGLVQTVATAPVGQRNHALNWAAFRSREIVEAGGDLHQVAGALLDAALSAGLGETESRRTIESGLGTRSAA